MHNRNLHEIDVWSVMIRNDVMERFDENRVQDVYSDSAQENEENGIMAMFVDDQGFLYMRLTHECGNEFHFTVSPDEWLPTHAA